MEGSATGSGSVQAALLLGPPDPADPIILEVSVEIGMLFGDFGRFQLVNYRRLLVFWSKALQIPTLLLRKTSWPTTWP